MPASSVDTFFACSLMVILTVSAMVGTAKVVQPYINDLSAVNGVERYRGLAEYILLTTGTPSNWGQLADSVPSAFGLASDNLQPYELDLDKVSRLNSDNVYAVTYPEIWAALGTIDMSLNIKIRPLFEVSISLISSQSEGNETIYMFRVSTGKSGFPVPAWLRCYAVVETYIEARSSSTAMDGVGFINATVPDSLSGTALFIVFAKAKANSQTMAFNAYSLSHGSDTLQPNETFIRLSPLKHVLNASFRHATVEVSNAFVFTYNHRLGLSQVGTGNQTVEYSVPRLLEASPMVLVLTGNNASTSFTEWTTYPQLPLEVGADFDDLTVGSKAIALSYLVSVNLVLYEAVITCRSLANIDA